MLKAASIGSSQTASQPMVSKSTGKPLEAKDLKRIELAQKIRAALANNDPSSAAKYYVECATLLEDKSLIGKVSMDAVANLKVTAALWAQADKTEHTDARKAEADRRKAEGMRIEAQLQGIKV